MYGEHDPFVCVLSQFDLTSLIIHIPLAEKKTPTGNRLALRFLGTWRRRRRRLFAYAQANGRCDFWIGYLGPTFRGGRRQRCSTISDYPKQIFMGIKFRWTCVVLAVHYGTHARTRTPDGRWMDVRGRPPTRQTPASEREMRLIEFDLLVCFGAAASAVRRRPIVRLRGGTCVWVCVHANGSAFRVSGLLKEVCPPNSRACRSMIYRITHARHARIGFPVLHLPWIAGRIDYHTRH